MASIQENRQPSRSWSFRSSGMTSPTEKDRLEALWQAGHLQKHCESLERFYRNKRNELQESLDYHSGTSDFIEIAQNLVRQYQTVDHLVEALDQIAEIETEIWIQGELGRFDRERIAAEWTERHAARWREWRTKEYLFAVERMGNRILDFIRENTLGQPTQG